MELKLKHISGYLPYGLKYILYGIKTNTINEISFAMAEDTVHTINTDNMSRKLVLHPMSDLYKEIDGVVGIVELAKIATGIDWNKRGWELSDLNEVSINQDGGVISFSFNKGNFSLKYRAKTKLNYTTWAVLNQLDLFAYLFQHHYDVYSLIPQNLAIDINTLGKEADDE